MLLRRESHWLLATKEVEPRELERIQRCWLVFCSLEIYGIDSKIHLNNGQKERKKSRVWASGPQFVSLSYNVSTLENVDILRLVTLCCERVTSTPELSPLDSSNISSSWNACVRGHVLPGASIPFSSMFKKLWISGQIMVEEQCTAYRKVLGTPFPLLGK